MKLQQKEYLDELNETEENSDLLYPTGGSRRKDSTKRFSDFYEEYSSIKQKVKRRNQGHEDYSVNRKLKRGEL